MKIVGLIRAMAVMISLLFGCSWLLNAGGSDPAQLAKELNLFPRDKTAFVAAMEEGHLTPRDRKRVLIQLRRFKGSEPRSFREKIWDLANIAKSKNAPASKRQGVDAMLGRWRAEFPSELREPRVVPFMAEKTAPCVEAASSAGSGQKDSDGSIELVQPQPVLRKAKLAARVAVVSAFLSPREAMLRQGRLERKEMGVRRCLEQEEWDEWTALVLNEEAAAEAIAFAGGLQDMECSLRKLEGCVKRRKERREQPRSWKKAAGIWPPVNERKRVVAAGASEQELAQWRQELADMKVRFQQAQEEIKGFERPVQEAVKKVAFAAEATEA